MISWLFIVKFSLNLLSSLNNFFQIFIFKIPIILHFIIGYIKDDNNANHDYFNYINQMYNYINLVRLIDQMRSVICGGS